MSRKIAVCAWCGPAMVVVASIGFLLSGLLPLPLSPHASATTVASFYADDATRVRAGFVIASLALPLVLPLVAVITLYLLRIEGRTPLLSFLQLASGAATAVLLTVPILLMAVCAFRPDRDPQQTQLLNDIAWLLFITPIAPFMVQNLAIGAAILGDARAEPVLPRWVGYLNLWVAFLFLPDILAFFFTSGPFGWNGVFVFWLAFVAYATWALAMGIVIAVDQRRGARAPAVPAAPEVVGAHA